MRKEVLFAIILGFALGGIILYGTQIANKAAKEAEAPSSPTVESIIASTPTPAAPSQDAKKPITITSPHSNFVATSTELIITGTATPNTTLAVISESGEQIIDTDSTGKFSAIVILIGGENQISVSGLIENQPQTTTLSVIYTSADLK